MLQTSFIVKFNTIVPFSYSNRHIILKALPKYGIVNFHMWKFTVVASTFILSFFLSMWFIFSVAHIFFSLFFSFSPTFSSSQTPISDPDSNSSEDPFRWTRSRSWRRTRRPILVNEKAGFRWSRRWMRSRSRTHSSEDQHLQLKIIQRNPLEPVSTKPKGNHFDETQRKRRGRERWGRKWVKKVICGEEEKKRKRVWGRKRVKKVICG